MGKPILPRNDADPLGVDPAERRAMADFDRRFRQIDRLYRDALASVPYTVVTVNAKEYQFDTNPDILAQLTDEIGRSVDRILLEGGADHLWFMVDYVVPVYQAGTAAAWRNLGSQSQAYKLGRPELESILQSEPYRRRLGYVAAREFENMQGLTAETKARMARVLTDGIAQGLNPRTVAKLLTAESESITGARANLIARTEIGNALRQARLDEAQQATADFGVQSRMMWFSALSPTTRESHRVRHGNLYTAQDVRLFYTRSGEACNCKCSQIEVLVDNKGEPLDPALVERVKTMKSKLKR